MIIIPTADCLAGKALNEPTRKEYLQTTKTPIEDPTSNKVPNEIIQRLIQLLTEFIQASRKKL